jgi:hypothetical protein
MGYMFEKTNKKERRKEKRLAIVVSIGHLVTLTSSFNESKERHNRLLRVSLKENRRLIVETVVSL